MNSRWMFLPVVAGLAAVSLAPLGRAAAPGAATPRQVPPRLREVILVFKTHFDLGYTDLASNVIQRYRTTMIDKALRVVDENRGLPPAQQFVWTLPGWPLHAILDWPEQTAERRARVWQAFQEGRFVVHALPASTHTELLGLEELVHGLDYSSQLTRQAGLALPRDAKMSDVPCHTWILPTLLRHAGVDFLHLGCNSASSSPQVPPLFWWEGPDGSRLLTFYSAGGYGSSLLPPADWPHQTWLALLQTGDNRGPPEPADVQKLLAQAAGQMPGVRVRIGRLSDFADAVRAEQPQLPVIRGDMPDTWIHGPMSDPAGAALARRVRSGLAATEILSALLQSWNVPRPDPSAVIAEAYEGSLLYGEHTWGGALRWVTKYGADIRFTYGDAWKAEREQGRFQKLETSWAEHSAYIEKAHALIRPALDSELRALAEAIAIDGKRVVVFNPLPWVRDGEVTVPREVGGIAALQPVEGGPPLPVEALAEGGRFIARAVPALGYRCYLPVNDAPSSAGLAADERAGLLENALVKVRLDPTRGTIRSFIDKRTGRELVDAAAPHGLGQYLYERYDADEVARFLRAYGKKDIGWFFAEFGKPKLPAAAVAPHRAVSPRNFTLHCELSAIAATARMTAPAGGDLPHAVTTRVTLLRDQPWVEVAVTVHDKAADPWPEAGWICLPVDVATPQFRVGRLASILDPQRDIVPGANRHLYAVSTGVSITDPQGRGVGICPVDHPLISLSEPGCWRFSADFVPRAPVAFVNLFNNQWTTNFRLWNSGTWTSRVRVWPVSRPEAETAIVGPSLEANAPLLSAAAAGRAGRLPTTASGITLSRKGIQVALSRATRDGEGPMLRLWELAGRGGPCRVSLPAGLAARSAQPVNLRGEPTGPSVAMADRSFEVPLGAFAPASVVLTPP